MKKRVKTHQGAEKTLRNIILSRRWLMIGGTVTALQALLTAFTRPEAQGALLFQSLLALACLGYGLSLTPRIRRMKQGEGR